MNTKCAGECGGCTSWCEPLLLAIPRRPVFSRQSPYNSFRGKINYFKIIITLLYLALQKLLCVKLRYYFLLIGDFCKCQIISVSEQVLAFKPIAVIQLLKSQEQFAATLIHRLCTHVCFHFVSPYCFCNNKFSLECVNPRKCVSHSKACCLGEFF